MSPTTTVAHTVAEAAPATRRRLSLPRRAAMAATLCAGLLFGALSAATPAAATTAATVKFQNAVAVNTLRLLNHERAVHHLPALRMNSRLIRSAHAHNLTMSGRNTMSHQLAGERFFSDRISRAGYKWSSAGENIGWNGNTTNSGVLTLETMMYNEKAPNDGHRRNILSRTYRDVGIDVYLDAKHHKIWLTQDFARAR